VTDFVGFPSTPYLTSDPTVATRVDKLLDQHAATSFLTAPVRVEEKMDGENLGLASVEGDLIAQSRGSYVALGGLQFRGLSSWLAPRRTLLAAALGEGLVMFGEWCADVHSVPYDSLPDWLLVFDVYDRRDGAFWSGDRRDALTAELGLATVPELFAGQCDIPFLRTLLGTSRCGREPMEGVVVRREAIGRTLGRAKLVRPDFMQPGDEHWRSGRRRPNRLDPGRWSDASS
jgi:ATP-dependent RNA circularization protein (DNA/RNA ligase family)